MSASEVASPRPRSVVLFESAIKESRDEPIVPGTRHGGANIVLLARSVEAVEQTRVGQMVNSETLVLDLTTDGTIPPDETLREAGEILKQQFLTLTSTHTSL